MAKRWLKPWIQRWKYQHILGFVGILFHSLARGNICASHCFTYVIPCQSILNQHGFRANLEGSMIPGKTLMIGLALWCCPWHGASSRVGTCWWLWPHGGQTVCNSNFKSKMETYHISYTPFWVNGFHIICPFLSQWLSYWNFSSWHLVFCKCFAMIFLERSFSHDGMTKTGSWKFDMDFGQTLFFNHKTVDPLGNVASESIRGRITTYIRRISWFNNLRVDLWSIPYTVTDNRCSTNGIFKPKFSTIKSTYTYKHIHAKQKKIYIYIYIL